MELAKAVVEVAKAFERFGLGEEGVAVVGLAGTCHEIAAKEGGARFIAGEISSVPRLVLKSLCESRIEWFADLEYSPEGKLLITKCGHQSSLMRRRWALTTVKFDYRKHDPIPLHEIEARVRSCLLLIFSFSLSSHISNALPFRLISTFKPYSHGISTYLQVTRLLTEHLVTTTDPSNPIHIGKDVAEVSICCHSDTSVSAFVPVSLPYEHNVNSLYILDFSGSCADCGNCQKAG